MPLCARIRGGEAGHRSIFSASPSVLFFHFIRTTGIQPPRLQPPYPPPAPPVSASDCGLHHADAPSARPFPLPPLAQLLFHSKMASAPEPLVSGCIFGLVVVSVSGGFWRALSGRSTPSPGEFHKEVKAAFLRFSERSFFNKPGLDPSYREGEGERGTGRNEGSEEGGVGGGGERGGGG